MPNLIRMMSCLLILLAFCGSAPVKPDVLKIKPTADFVFTGDGTSTEWNQTEWVLVPFREGARSYQTKVKLLYSQTGIYCLFSCEDKTITSTLKQDNADLYEEDVVEIFFWPDESVPVYFEYELSPYNYELPIMVPNLKGNFFGWLPWHYDGAKKTRHGATINKNQSWTAEFFIPYALLKPLLKEVPTKGTLWRANMYRLDYDEKISEWSWQLTGKNFHDYEKFGTLLFD